MTPADRQFGKELGRRLAQLRQEAGLTQHTVAAHLGIAQQTLAHYEVGRLRLPVALVPRLAALFAVSTDALLGVASASARGSRAGKRGPTPKLQQQLERLSRLPKTQQQTVLAMLDGVLLQHG
jgi:transcriptional regulator with XRE-family HTH domain